MTEDQGQPLRLIVRTPLGPLAEVCGPIGAAAGGEGAGAEGRLFFLHADHQGTIHLATDPDGIVAGQCEYGPFGEPLGHTTATGVSRPALASRHPVVLCRRALVRSVPGALPDARHLHGRARRRAPGAPPLVGQGASSRHAPRSFGIGSKRRANGTPTSTAPTIRSAGWTRTGIGLSAGCCSRSSAPSGPSPTPCWAC